MRLTAGEHRLSGTIVRLFEGLPASYGGAEPVEAPAASAAASSSRRKDATPEQLAKAREAFEKRLAEMAPANDVRVAGSRCSGRTRPRADPRPRACARSTGRPVAAASGRRRAARRDPHAARAPRLPAAGHRRGRGPARRPRDAGADARRGLRGRPRARALRRCWSRPTSCSASSGAGRPTAGAPGRPLTDHELASRLSYFLWVSMPDDALLDLADQGRLSRPEVLEAQVARMLKDEKAAALVEAFAGQWLQFRALESVAPDRERFPDFDYDLRLSMRRETELLFLNLLREDRSILDLIDARYSFVNERLAQHYGIAGVKGPEFRRVELAGRAPRRDPDAGERAHGLVVRDAHLAGAARQVDPREHAERAAARSARRACRGSTRRRSGADASLRQQLEAHRTQPTCAACHPKMDPLGFSPRELRRDRRLARRGRQVADRRLGHAARRPHLHGRAEGSRASCARTARPSRGAVTAKLLTYALGRGLERYDRRTVDAIATQARGERLSLLGARAGDREEPAVPAAAGGGRRHEPSHPQAPRRGGRSCGAWARAWRCPRSTP